MLYVICFFVFVLSVTDIIYADKEGGKGYDL